MNHITDKIFEANHTLVHPATLLKAFQRLLKFLKEYVLESEDSDNPKLIVSVEKAVKDLNSKLQAEKLGIISASSGMNLETAYLSVTLLNQTIFSLIMMLKAEEDDRVPTNKKDVIYKVCSRGSFVGVAEVSAEDATEAARTIAYHSKQKPLGEAGEAPASKSGRRQERMRGRHKTLNEMWIKYDKLIKLAHNALDKEMIRYFGQSFDGYHILHYPEMVGRVQELSTPPKHSMWKNAQQLAIDMVRIDELMEKACDLETRVRGHVIRYNFIKLAEEKNAIKPIKQM
uniref:Non-structural maintenance of chromosomes element 4 n=1 Tax=Heterorhabditis bacteriophora TaxID=37862 RepID=A0A1I7WJK4_HETBA